ncbi:vancomycin resistance protein [Lysinibacillus sp. 2017]|uniref:YdcF family protein n=1 Tax=unclassified Lysinibacillus TaxID=2636778 RepID=UPI000D52862A|nr:MULTISPECIES: YdcF family protein [unclassified Lysinibacillus]AWE07568.1 vancomycin resistance protein [Lysinibacillus sp. 2017]TGN36731.1 YdcF family protein [Lysinibacillus sp. S2017]
MKNWWIGLIGILVIVLTLFFWLGYEIKQGTKNTADGTNDYAIVLGAKVKPGGIPSLSLANRLDVAAAYLQEHPHVKVIVSGGQGEDEDRTEASVMHDVLVEKGIDPGRILIEDKSTSTYENLLFSKELLPNDITAITIISNDFHLRRATFLANKLNLQADIIAAPTPTVVKAKSHLRERLALLKTFIVGQ